MRLGYAEILAKLDSNPIPLRMAKTLWILDHFTCKRAQFNQAANNNSINQTVKIHRLIYAFAVKPV